MSTRTDMSFKEKWNTHKTKIKLIAILSIEFIAVITILLLVLFAGKKSYTVTFDLNGGTLLGGEVVQRVVQGQSATPPSVAKYGHYLLRWSGSYKSVTRDVTVRAIWEYETSPGIEYYVPENTNYCEIAGSYREIQGDVYIGAYYDNRQVMGIKEQAFKDRVGIRGVYLLDGILGIADEAFAGCTSLETIDIPSTVVRIGKEAFKNCTSLREITLPASLKFIDESAFEGCTALEKVTFYEFTPEPDRDGNIDETRIIKSAIQSIGARAFFGCESLSEIILPEGLEILGQNAFNTPEMTIKVYFTEENTPKGFADGCFGEETVVIYDFLNIPEEPEDEGEESEDGKDGNDDKNDKVDEDDKPFWEGIL